MKAAPVLFFTTPPSKTNMLAAGNPTPSSTCNTPAEIVVLPLYVFVPVRINKPGPVFVIPPVPLPLMIAPEITAQSAAELASSSTWIVRFAPARLMPFCSVTTLAAVAEPNLSVPTMFVPTVLPQVNVEVPLLSRKAKGPAPAAKPPPVFHWKVPEVEPTL